MNRIRLSLIISLIALGGLLTACPAPGDGAASEGRDDTAIEGDALDGDTLEGDALEDDSLDAAPADDPLDAPE